MNMYSSTLNLWCDGRHIGATDHSSLHILLKKNSVVSTINIVFFYEKLLKLLYTVFP